jgi:cytochrome c2
MTIAMARPKRNMTMPYRTAVAVGFACALAGCTEGGSPQRRELNRPFDPQRIVGGDPETGRRIVASVECGVCHVIPGIAGADGIVGPPLTDFAHRQFIGGVVPNHPSLLVRFVRDPPSIAPATGMPDLGLTEDEAQHVAAYLYTLR